MQRLSAEEESASRLANEVDEGLALDQCSASQKTRPVAATPGFAPVRGNRVTLLRDGEATYAAMFKAMRDAAHQINLETYILEDDEIGHRLAELLASKAAQGINVNLIYDSVGSIDTPAAFFDALRNRGVHVREFNPINPLKVNLTRGWRINQRDHRKILVVDGALSFVGGVNISSVYSGSSARRSRQAHRTPSPGAEHHWRDTHAQVEGPASRDLQKLFVEDWLKLHGEPLDEAITFPDLARKGTQTVRVLGGTPDYSVNPIFTCLIFAIERARRSVHLTNAYFVPDPQTTRALVRAVKRGVDVTLALPGVSDSALVLNAARSYYAKLLKSGVKIYERKDALLHAKTAVIDGVWSTIGSTNLDWRSRLHNEEVNVVVFGKTFGQEAEQMFAEDIAASEPILPQQWAKRSVFEKTRELAARLWAYWL